MNLAGVLPWIHWRGVIVMGLLACGNLFCMACPFTLAADARGPLAARRLALAARGPERFATRAPPSRCCSCFYGATKRSLSGTILGSRPGSRSDISGPRLPSTPYFTRGSFCKYVCPIGQFNFVQSLVSPWEVKVRHAAICAACTTHDCIRGNAQTSGCAMQLFQPRKVGNLDCTFCLDCARACPHDNVGLLFVTPGATLWSDAWRSGIGRFSRRGDIAALVAALAFGALANAGGMVEPMVAWQTRLRTAWGNPPEWTITTLYYLATIILAPLALVSLAAVASRAWGGLAERRTENASRFVFALVPLTFSLWLAHYSFHFITSWTAALPAAQRFCNDVGLMAMGRPAWLYSCCAGIRLAAAA